jgi:hypothetical protein
VVVLLTAIEVITPGNEHLPIEAEAWLCETRARLARKPVAVQRPRGWIVEFRAGRESRRKVPGDEHLAVG